MSSLQIKRSEKKSKENFPHVKEKKTIKMKFKFNLFLFFVALFVAYTLASPINLKERDDPVPPNKPDGK